MREENEQTAMSRLNWWKCVVFVWCLLDDAKDKTKQAQIDAYKNQCKSLIEKKESIEFCFF